MDYELMIDSLPMLWEGTKITLGLFVLAMVFSTVLAVPLAIARVQKAWYLRWPVEGFAQVFRGTPLLVQLFIVYYGLAQVEFIRSSWAWAYLRSPYWCATLALTLNTAAYTVHVLRGAIQAVPAGEVEAAHAFGMSSWAIYQRVILPRAVLLALPAYGNEVIKTMKRTSLASAITIADLTGVANMLVSRTFAPYEIFTMAAVIYLVFAFLTNRAVRVLEYRLSRHTRPMPSMPSGPKAQPI